MSIPDQTDHPPGPLQQVNSSKVEQAFDTVESTLHSRFAMVRRLTPPQIRNRIRRAEQKQKQAVRNYNAAVRKYNAAAKTHNRNVKGSVDDYNREVRSHNARVRRNRARLKLELQRLQSSSSASSSRTPYRRSVARLGASLDQLAANPGTRGSATEFFDLAEGEAANSVFALNELEASDGQERDSAALRDGLQSTRIEQELGRISQDLHDRWNGALFALSPANPDAARHFCTSAREILSSILDSAAPDDDVLAAKPSAARTDRGRVTRREKVTYCLSRQGGAEDAAISFVEDDLDDVLALFREFNDATHGSAGRFPLRQLHALKSRVEDAIAFLATVLWAQDNGS